MSQRAVREAAKALVGKFPAVAHDDAGEYATFKAAFGLRHTAIWKAVKDLRTALAAPGEAGGEVVERCARVAEEVARKCGGSRVDGDRSKWALHESHSDAHDACHASIEIAAAIRALPAAPVVAECARCGKPEDDDAHNQLGHNFDPGEPVAEGAKCPTCGSGRLPSAQYVKGILGEGWKACDDPKCPQRGAAGREATGGA